MTTHTQRRDQRPKEIPPCEACGQPFRTQKGADFHASRLDPASCRGALEEIRRVTLEAAGESAYTAWRHKGIRKPIMKHRGLSAYGQSKRESMASIRPQYQQERTA